MKKIYLIIMLCVMAVALASCGGSSTAEKEPEEPEDYIEACEQGEFIKAYSVVNKLKGKMQNYENGHAGNIQWGREGLSIGMDELATYNNLKKNFEDAERYVVLQEATFILESQGLEGMTKIAMIVKEHDAKWLYKDLIDIAIAMGNDEMADRMKKLAGPVEDSSKEE